jgi:hypothetical protein
MRILQMSLAFYSERLVLCHSSKVTGCASLKKVRFRTQFTDLALILYIYHSSVMLVNSCVQASLIAHIRRFCPPSSPSSLSHGPAVTPHNQSGANVLPHRAFLDFEHENDESLWQRAYALLRREAADKVFYGGAASARLHIRAAN